MQRFLGNLRKSFRGNKGFTLIELIVVIAVIGVLVLLAAPKFLGYTRDAKVAALQSDVKTLSNAALLFNIESTNDEWPYSEQTVPGTYDEEVAVTAIDTAALGLLNSLRVKGFNDVDLSNGIIRFPADAIETSGELYKYVKNINNPVSDYILVVEGKLEGEVFHFPASGTAGQPDGDRLTTWYGVDSNVTVNDTGGSPNVLVDVSHINGIVKATATGMVVGDPVTGPNILD